MQLSLQLRLCLIDRLPAGVSRHGNLGANDAPYLSEVLSLAVGAFSLVQILVHLRFV